MRSILVRDAVMVDPTLSKPVQKIQSDRLRCLTQRGNITEADAVAGGLWSLIAPRMDCAWKLAEQTARAMGADLVRIDIFVTPGKPGCVLNEISLSSAMPYGQHSEHLARLWTLPTARAAVRRNAMGEPAASTPIYLLRGLY